MKHILTGFLAFTLLSAFAETPPPIEVRFCPASAIHTYPLESRREVNSLLLQNVAVLNHSAAAFKIRAVTIELLQSGKVTDSRRLEASELQRFAERGAKMQAGGVLQQVAFQFGGTSVIPSDVKLAGPDLNENQSLLITSQVFAFTGPRASLRVKVDGNTGGKAPERGRARPTKNP